MIFKAPEPRYVQQEGMQVYTSLQSFPFKKCPSRLHMEPDNALLKQHFRLAMNKKMIICFLTSAIVLTGCGGGGSSSSTGSTEETVNASGKVIDGYISGATVYLDLNFNGVLDAGEPQSISGDAGDYTLELSPGHRECLGYAPIVVDVPIGAIDEDQGEVEEAYQMVFAPPFEPVSDRDVFNISPLTSVLWSTIQAELRNDLVGLTCSGILEREQRREQLRGILEASINDVIAHYNISEAQLFSDFIANGDTPTQEKAIRIVKGLKKSFTETTRLKTLHPDALLVRANYHQFDDRDAGDLYPDAWYREYQLINETRQIFRLDKLTDDLAEVARPIIYGEGGRIQRDGLSYYDSFELESRNGDSSNYSCDSKEGVSTVHDGKTYELTNLVNKQASEFADCQAVDFTTETYMRYAFVEYSDGTSDYSSQFMYFPPTTDLISLSDWLGLRTQLDSLDPNVLINTYEGLPYGYTEIGMGGADSWHKRKSYQDGEDQIRLYKNSLGEHERITTFPDGTSLKECSTDGVDWGACG